MEIKELGHLVLYVRNLDRSASFYRNVLSWRQIIGEPGDSPLPFRAAAFSAPSGRTHHELLLIEVGEDAGGLPPGQRTGLNHFGLKVGDSDDELRAALALRRSRPLAAHALIRSGRQLTGPCAWRHANQPPAPVPCPLPGVWIRAISSVHAQ